MFLCLDLETTGFNPKNDRIIEVAAVKFDEAGKIHDTFTSLVNPCLRLTPFISLLTGITDTDLAGAPEFHTLQKSLQSFCAELPMVGHNVLFDKNFLTENGVCIEAPTHDTVELSRILFPKERSYSLEILAKSFSLPHRPSHRALDDVLTTVDLFLFLLSQIANVNKHVKKELIAVLQKSDWSLKTFFHHEPTAGSNIAIKNVATAETFPVHVPPRNAKFDSSLLLKNSIIEAQKYFPLTLLPRDKKFFVAYSSSKQCAHRLREDTSAATIAEPSFYISSQRLKKFIHEKKSFTDEETSFLTKILFWLSRTETGLRHEISLINHEYGMWNDISDAEGSDTYFTRAFQNAQAAKIVLGHHSFLLSSVFKKLNIEHTIIEEALELEDNFTRTLTTRITERELIRNIDDPAIAGRVSILFGLIGMFFERNTDPMYRSDVVMDKTFPHTEEGKRILKAIESIGEPVAALHTLLTTSDENYVRYVSGYSGTMQVVSAPLALPSVTGTQTTSYIDTALSLNGSFDFMQSIFQLKATHAEIIVEPFKLENLDIEIPEEVPEPNSEGYFQSYIDIVQKAIDEFGGNIFLLLQSKKAVEATYNKIFPYCRERDITMYAQGMTGGTGKVLDMFESAPNSSVLIGMQSLFELIEPIEDHLRYVIFQKIPFPFSSNPVFNLRPNKYPDGFNSYILPRAYLRFKKSLAELNQSKTPKKIIILDRRLFDRKYSIDFMREIYSEK